jgi:hypothetical protein
VDGTRFSLVSLSISEHFEYAAGQKPIEPRLEGIIQKRLETSLWTASFFSAAYRKEPAVALAGQGTLIASGESAGEQRAAGDEGAPGGARRHESPAHSAQSSGRLRAIRYR